MGIELGANSTKGEIFVVLGDLDAIKLKIHSFQGKNDPEMYLEWEKKVEQKANGLPP